MRHTALEVLKKRKTKILNAVIHHYIRIGKPVGSDVLIKEYNISLSPATVRNLMAELEEDGYLTHPHTSSGRIPTDKGYRSYVDSLVKLQSYAIEEEERIKREYEGKHNEIEDILSETSRILSGLSQYTGFVMTPKAQYDKIKNIELVQISEEDLLVILLTQSGMVKHKKVKAYLTYVQLGKLRNFLNEKLRGISIAQANRKIISEIKDFRRNESEILKIAEKISYVFYNIQDDIYIDGTSNVVAAPDFSDFEPVKLLIKFNEDKEKFIEIINKDFNNGGINVKIGSENTLDGLKDLSMITTTYKNRERAVGVLGIIGPKRMEYEKMMLLVNRISEMLNRFFKEMS
ncbi:heat-inducible transcription repressor HrcA [Endomicrobiia bacterium]|nr:heat-inducible transcription repressor HrcA [Endomicrobiia bacterium]GHT11537.1 heat-inducible transcription repressor HrcA [Endomicrobiia bacterium]GHT21251.1 heat-inducible transcription repressor HrcA [Endomicrobiia bacterium]GHT27540.1 heat-inducible transcription repressor HrcA [Endomicrobiia bacterium]GHT29419.1 heat-inducible transcription repressor HrcA [Endomicrobiia bacterium]